MPQVEIFGHSVEANPLKNKALLFAGIGVVALLWLSRRKASASPAAGQAPAAAAVDTGPQVEFARLTQETDLQTAALAASNKLEMTRLDLERLKITGEQGLAREQLSANFALQAGQQQRTCIPWAQWFALSNPQRDALNKQVTDGAVLLLPAAQGMCYSPTQRGVAGSQPQVVQKNRANLLGGSSTVTGPAGSVPMAAPASRGGIAENLTAILHAVEAVYGGTMTGAGAPSDLPPGVIVS